MKSFEETTVPDCEKRIASGYRNHRILAKPGIEVVAFDDQKRVSRWAFLDHNTKAAMVMSFAYFATRPGCKVVGEWLSSRVQAGGHTSIGET